MNWQNQYTPNIIFFFTSRITEQIHLLRTDRFKQIVIESLRWYMQKYMISLYGYVFMDNHFHLLLSAPTADGLRLCIQHTLRQSSTQMAESLEYFAGIRPNPPQFVANLPAFNPKYVEQAKQMLNVFARHANGTAKYAIWKEKARGIPIRSQAAFRVKLNYIHDNPVRAGIVKIAADYPYSSCKMIDSGEVGGLPIEFPEWW